jgi:hypothetical protein
LFVFEKHRIINLMIERIDLVHAEGVHGFNIKWHELGWNKLLGEFSPGGIGAELVELEG